MQNEFKERKKELKLLDGRRQRKRRKEKEKEEKRRNEYEQSQLPRHPRALAKDLAHAKHIIDH